MEEDFDEEKEEQDTIFTSSTATATTTTTTTTTTCSMLRRLLSKRRTWVCLFVLVYALLFSFSWNLLGSILSWYNTTSASSSSGWPALYASMLFGAVFGLLSMAAALAVAIPATVVTWITVLVLLTFCGKPRRSLVLEGKKITADITGFVFKILLKEGNIVAAVCAVLGYFALVHRSNGGEKIEALNLLHENHL